MSTDTPRLERVYRLRDDAAGLRSLQEGSLSAGPLGLKITHGLVGTDPWWDHIDRGTLPLHRVRGVVRGLWLGMHHSEPGSFAMQLPDGTWFQSMTMLEAQASAERFTLGRHVEADYVLQTLKTPLDGGTDSTQVLLELRIDGGPPADVLPMGPCYFTRMSPAEAATPVLAPVLAPAPSPVGGPSTSARAGWRRWLPWRRGSR